jgi:AAA family ATP:ADP antiporter
MFAVAWPGLIAAVVTRFFEAMNRYTFNRTGMELLYLPLPVELRNRTKVFVDVFIDRAGRGIAGILLAVILAAGLRDIRMVAILTIGFAVVWMVLARVAHHEYLGTLRSRLERRRLDLESARATVGDPDTIALLEQTAATASSRQVCYALSLLAEAPGYNLAPLLRRVASSDSPDVRAKVYELARSAGLGEFLIAALAEIRVATPAVKPAVAYMLALSEDAAGIAREFVDDPNHVVAQGVVDALAEQPELARTVLTPAWLAAAAADRDPERRALAACALGVVGGNASMLLQLIRDPDVSVATAACRAAGILQEHSCMEAVVRRLADTSIRGVAIEALAAYGPANCGLLGDFLADERVAPAIRRQLPRALKLIRDQRSVDVLLKCIGQQDLTIRAAVLKALNTLREAAPGLQYGDVFITEQILSEARHYFELYSALAPFQAEKTRRSATGLLERALEERLAQTIERLFRLLGLRYPPREMYAAYLAVRHRKKDQFVAALEFLDNVLDRPLKRVLLPMLDSSERMGERGRDLFGVELRDAESAVGELIRSGDPWLAACAMATAAERKMLRLAEDIARAGERAGGDVAEVARAAVAELAVSA